MLFVVCDRYFLTLVGIFQFVFQYNKTRQFGVFRLLFGEFECQNGVKSDKT